MALIVESGTADTPSANSYLALADVDDFHGQRCGSTWVGADAAKEAAILRAMDYLENQRWRGYRLRQDTPLSWPRSNVYDFDGFLISSDVIPALVKRALCEAALRELIEPGCLQPDLDRGGMVSSKSIDVISTSYMPGAPGGVLYTSIRKLLGKLVQGSSIEVGRG